MNRTLRTDATGFYGSVDLPAGSYTLSITVPGSLPQRADFSVGNALVAEHAFELQPQSLDFISSSRDALRRMVLTWHSRPGQTYRIEVSTDLGGWTPAEPVWISQGWSTSWTSPVPPPGTERQFFRIL